jgi:hypothetical protein
MLMLVFLCQHTCTFRLLLWGWGLVWVPTSLPHWSTISSEEPGDFRYSNITKKIHSTLTTTFQAQIRDFRVGFIPRLLDGILQVLLPTFFLFLRIRGNCQSSITTLNLGILIFETKWVGTVTVNNQTVI